MPKGKQVPQKSVKLVNKTQRVPNPSKQFLNETGIINVQNLFSDLHRQFINNTAVINVADSTLRTLPR